MSPVTLPEAAAAYLAALERELADLPPDERAELLEEVEASLLEAGDAPEAELGTPAHPANTIASTNGDKRLFNIEMFKRPQTKEPSFRKYRFSNW